MKKKKTKKDQEIEGLVEEITLLMAKYHVLVELGILPDVRLDDAA